MKLIPTTKQMAFVDRKCWMGLLERQVRGRVDGTRLLLETQECIYNEI